MNCSLTLRSLVSFLFLLLSALTGLTAVPTFSVKFSESKFFDEPVFSFTYGSKSSAELLPKWKRDRSSRKLDAQRTERRIVWTDPQTGLEVRCVGVEYSDFQAVEWTVYFKNNGKVNSPILEDIQAINVDFKRDKEGEFILHGTKGDSVYSR